MAFNNVKLGFINFLLIDNLFIHLDPTIISFSSAGHAAHPDVLPDLVDEDPEEDVGHADEENQERIDRKAGGQARKSCQDHHHKTWRKHW